MTRKILALLVVGSMAAACSSEAAKSPDVTDSVRKSLDQASLKDVSVSQDRDKGVVTLTGHVATDADKMQAESIAKSLAGTQIVADEIAVVPPAIDTKAVDADIDKGIEKNVDAVLLQNHAKDGVKLSVTQGVVTLTGTVATQAKRSEAEKLAATVPNVKQVVNKLDVKTQKATSHGGR